MDSENQFEKSISFSEILFYVQRNLRIISICILLIAVCLGAFRGLTLPQYQTTGSMLIKGGKSKDQELFNLATGNDKNMINNQLQILKSRKISTLAAERLLDSNFEGGFYLFETRDENIDIFNLPVQALRKVVLIEKNHYDSIDDAIEAFGSKEKLIEVAAKRIKGGLIVQNNRKTDIISLSYVSNNAKESALIVNTVMQTFQEQDINWQNDEHLFLQQFLQNQLEEKKVELSIIEDKLKTFQETNKVFGVDENSKILLEKLQLVETNYYEAETELNILLEQEKYLKNQLSFEESRFAENLINTINSQLFSLREDLSMLESEYATAKAKNNSNSLAVENIQTRINALKSAIKADTARLSEQGLQASNPIEFRQSLIDQLIQINAEKNTLIAKKEEYGDVVEIYEQKVEELPGQFLALSKLQRDKVILDGTYSLMKRKFEESKISEASELGKIQILDFASPSVGSTWPPSIPLIMIAGLILSVMISGFVILLKEFLDKAIKGFDFVERKGISIIGLIPKFDDSLINEEDFRHLVVEKNPKSPISEGFRTIRTALTFSFDESKKCQSIIVSSSGPQEGKSTTSANIAIAFAQLGKKTLILDMDMRKPVLHKVFDIDKSVGFSNIYVGNKSLKESIHTSEIKNLSVLPCGPIPPNPSEIISSKKTRDIIDELKNEFEIIIVDTPPIVAVADCVQLKEYFDQLLLVVRSGVTQKGAFERAYKNLEIAGYQIKNCIFNDVDSNSSYGGDYYYNYNYYAYYYGENKGEKK